MFLEFIFLSLTLPFSKCVLHKNEFWWDSSVIYNVYPKSFKDSNGDGVGDLRGIIEKLSYFKYLGVDAIYLNPIFKSPMADHGYDVSDFKVIDPSFGTLSDLEELIKECKKLGLKFILDFVPNHTSDEHEWFLKSINRIDPYTDYYLWRNASGYASDGTPLVPNNWLSFFLNTPAWTWNDKRKQFYYHVFLKEQPELNYGNELVIAESKKTLQFWLDKNIDGVRIDALQFLYENVSCPDEELISPTLPKDSFHSYRHICRSRQPKNLDILRQWRAVFSDHSRASDNQRRLILAEAYVSRQEMTEFYENGADIVYNNLLFPIYYTLQNTTLLVDYLRSYAEDWSKRKFTMNWMASNHDIKRIISIFGEPLADCVSLIILLLPGNAFWYYGEELGMINYIPEIFKRAEGGRTPFQWDSSFQAGFSKSNTTWLPINSNFHQVNAETEMKDPRSRLNFFRKLIQTRNLPQMKNGELQIIPVSERIFAFVRFLPEVPGEKFISLLNFGKQFEYVFIGDLFPELPEKMYIHVATLSSEQKEGEEVEKAKCFMMRPHTAVLLSTMKPTSSKSSPISLSTPLALLLSVLVYQLV